MSGNSCEMLCYGANTTSNNFPTNARLFPLERRFSTSGIASENPSFVPDNNNVYAFWGSNNHYSVPPNCIFLRSDSFPANARKSPVEHRVSRLGIENDDASTIQGNNCNYELLESNNHYYETANNQPSSCYILFQCI